MSTFDSDDLGGPCHVLTEDGVRRLWQLRDHLAFLSQLAQPGTADEEAATRSEGALGELPVFLALVAEQVDRVSAAVSRSGRGGAKKANDAYATAGAGAGAVDERFSFGLTMDQMDALNRLAALLSAHGDVVSASETTVFVDHTLPVVGQAIFEGAQAVGEILREVEVDQFLWAKPSATGVREERAVYAAVSVHEPWPLAAAMPDDASLLH